MTIYLSGHVRPELFGRADVGLMLQPGMGQFPDVRRTPWAADNGCYAAGDAFRPVFFWNFLERMEDYRETCLFATAPDVVGDAERTLERSCPWLRPLRSAGYRAAFVAQEGIERIAVPWDEFDCLFVGGLSEKFKLSPIVLALVAEANERGKWTHLGRVNSDRRFDAAILGGYGSADGTFPEVWTGPESSAT